MKKFLIISLLVVFVNVDLFAQKKDPKPIVYSLENNDLDFSYIGGGLNFDMALANYNYSLFGIGPNIKYLSEKISIDASARFHLLDHISQGRNPEVFSIYEKERSNDISVDFGYFFSNNISTGDVMMTVGGRGNTRFYTLIEANSAERYGVNLGLKSGLTYYNFHNTDFEKAPSALVDGYITTTYHQFNVAKIGGNRTKIENLKINTDRFGSVTYTKMSKLYFNTLFLVQSALDDVFVEQNVVGVGGTYYSQRIIDGMDRRRLGFSVGYEFYVMNDYMIDDKKRDVGFLFEVGSQPGPKTTFGNNMYVDIKVRINVGKIL